MFAYKSQAQPVIPVTSAKRRQPRSEARGSQANVNLLLCFQYRMMDGVENDLIYLVF